MSRVQLALNVDDLDQAITFYSTLFNTAPAKVKPGYANFAVAQPPLKLVLIENPGHGGTLNHLGVEVESSQAVHSEIGRLTNEGMFTAEETLAGEKLTDLDHPDVARRVHQLRDLLVHVEDPVGGGTGLGNIETMMIGAFPDKGLTLENSFL